MATDPVARMGFAFALVAAAGYGLNIVTAQISAQAGISGPTLVFYRVFVVLALMLIVIAITRAPLAVAAGERGAMLVFGLTSFVVGTSYMSSVAFLPVTVAAVIFYLFPILIVIAEPWVQGTRFGAARLAVALLAFAGVVLVVGPRFDSLDPRGLGLAVLAAAGAAIQFFAAVRLTRTGTATKLIWSHLIVLPGVTLTLLALGGIDPPGALAAAPWAVVVTLGSYVAAIALQVMALTRIPPSAAGLAFCAEPLFAAAFAALVLGERLIAVQYAGGLLVLLAIVAQMRLGRPRTA